MRFATILALSTAIPFSVVALSYVGSKRVDAFVEERYTLFVERYPGWRAVWEGKTGIERERAEIVVDSLVKEGIKALLKEDALSFAFGIDSAKALWTLHRRLLALYSYDDRYSFYDGSVRVASSDTVYARLLRKQRDGLLCNTVTVALGAAYALFMLDTALSVYISSPPLHMMLVKDSVAFATSPGGDSLESLSFFRKAGKRVWPLSRLPKPSP